MKRIHTFLTRSQLIRILLRAWSQLNKLISRRIQKTLLPSVSLVHYPKSDILIFREMQKESLTVPGGFKTILPVHLGKKWVSMTRKR